MKDVDYFLNEETKYIEPSMEFDEEMGRFDYPYDPLSFLSQKQFSISCTPWKNAHYEDYGLSDVEILIFQVFIGRWSGVFRGDRYGSEIPELIQEMRYVLESAISKAPKFTGTVLYRFCKDDPVEFKEGNIYEPLHSLTTTKDDWGKDTNTYIITPLSADKTKAHCLYEIYNHGDENQVNFETGAKFKIDKVSQEAQGNICVFMTEVE